MDLVKVNPLYQNNRSHRYVFQFLCGSTGDIWLEVWADDHETAITLSQYSGYVGHYDLPRTILIDYTDTEVDEAYSRIKKFVAKDTGLYCLYDPAKKMYYHKNNYGNNIDNTKDIQDIFVASKEYLEHMSKSGKLDQYEIVPFESSKAKEPELKPVKPELYCLYDPAQKSYYSKHNNITSNWRTENLQHVLVASKEYIETIKNRGLNQYDIVPFPKPKELVEPELYCLYDEENKVYYAHGEEDNILNAWTGSKEWAEDMNKNLRGCYKVTRLKP